MPRGLTGIDWFASWFIAYFVQGKFWTIFSLLFGMGFAVMLARAAEAGREFKIVYLRRVLALAIFGGAHYVLLWQGDILFSYAVAALMLMVVLYGKTIAHPHRHRYRDGLAFIPVWELSVRLPAGLAAAGLLAIYLRSGKRVNIAGHGIPLFSFLLLVIGTLLVIAAAVFWLLPDGPVEPRQPLSVFGPLVLVAGWLSWKYYDPAELRSVRLAVSVYLFLGMSIISAGLIQRFAPDPDAGVVVAVGQPTITESARGEAAAHGAVTPADKPVEEKPTAPPPQTREERAAVRKAEREKRLAEAKAKKERRSCASSPAAAIGRTVKWSVGRFPEKAAERFRLRDSTGIAHVLARVLVRAVGRHGECRGASADSLASWPCMACQLASGSDSLGSLIAMSHTPGDRYDGWGIAVGLSLVGNLPACLGYVGLVVLMLRSQTGFARIGVSGRLGRMLCRPTTSLSH